MNRDVCEHFNPVDLPCDKCKRDAFEAQDFARCAGNPCFAYCKNCKRNVINSPLHPKADHQWWMGPWIMEDEKCPSFVEKKEDV